MMTIEDKAESVRLHLFTALDEIKSLKGQEELEKRIAMALLYAIDVEAFIINFNKVGKGETP